MQISGFMLLLIASVTLHGCVENTDEHRNDRIVLIDGPSLVVPEGQYEYSVIDVCLAFVFTCGPQRYSVTDVRITGDSTIGIPSGVIYSSDSFRIQVSGEGSATAIITATGEDGHEREIEKTITARYPDTVVMDCCSGSAKIPVGQSGDIRVKYYAGNSYLETPANYLGINIPVDIEVANITSPEYLKDDVITITVPEWKDRLLITSDYDANLSFEVQSYDVYDIDEVVIFASRSTAEMVTLQPLVKIETISPITVPNIDYLYQIQTPTICEFTDATLEKEGVGSVEISKLQSGSCETKITLGGIIESNSPLVVNPVLDPAIAPFQVHTHIFE